MCNSQGYLNKDIGISENDICLWQIDLQIGITDFDIRIFLNLILNVYIYFQIFLISL